MLTAVMLLLCVAKLGPLLVLLAVTYTLLNEWLVPASDTPPVESA